jgi:hypothetical protein
MRACAPTGSFDAPVPLPEAVVPATELTLEVPATRAPRAPLAMPHADHVAHPETPPF